MAEDVLVELETAPPLAGSLANIDDLIRVIAREVNQAVRGLAGSALTFDHAWQRIVTQVARGQTAKMHAFRPRLASALEERLTFLRQTHFLAIWLAKLNRCETVDPDVLLAEIARLENLQATTLDRWHTPDDLEDLAARDYPLSRADLDRAGASRTPPPAFFAEESKPF